MPWHCPGAPASPSKPSNVRGSTSATTSSFFPCRRFIRGHKNPEYAYLGRSYSLISGKRILQQRCRPYLSPMYFPPDRLLLKRPQLLQEGLEGESLLHVNLPDQISDLTHFW